VAIDKVQPLKIEDTTTGGDEVDQFPTGLNPQEDHVELAGVVFDDATHRDENVRVWRDGNDLKFQDVSNSTPHTLTDLLSSSSGITESQHEALATLTHEVDATSYAEYTYLGAFPTSEVIWTNSSKTQKIREESYTYSGGSLVDQITTIQYDSIGVEKMRVVEDVTYTLNGYIGNIQKTKSETP
jgi:hypothetical protein